MKGVIAREPGTGVLFTDIPPPVPGVYDALVRLDACGICNSTDYKLVKNTFVAGSLFRVPSSGCLGGRACVVDGGGSGAGLHQLQYLRLDQIGQIVPRRDHLIEVRIL